LRGYRLTLANGFIGKPEKHTEVLQ
jgi:hypothetical protein